MIKTAFGPVPLRAPREEQKIKLDRGWYGNKGVGQSDYVHIKKGWLKSQTVGGRTKTVDLDKESGHQSRLCYRAHVKQAMLIAVSDMEAANASGPQWWSDVNDPMNNANGQPLSDAERLKAQKGIEERRRTWVEGAKPVPLGSLEDASKAGLRGRGYLQNRQLLLTNKLVKKCKHTGQTIHRFFRIDEGMLKAYRYADRRKCKPRTYDLSAVECSLESSLEQPPYEPFHVQGTAGKPVYRVRIVSKQRSSGPLYLYSDDERESKNWERAVRMSKYMQKAGDRGAMSTVVGRVSSIALAKAWSALVSYATEIQSIRDSVKYLSRRLVQGSLARGWVKARLVYKQNMQKEERRRMQLETVKRILQERNEQLAAQGKLSPEVLRGNALSSVQQRFRNYRRLHAMSRNYALGQGEAITRTQQACHATLLGSASDALTCQQALRLVFDGRSIECVGRLESNPDFFESKSLSYSTMSTPGRLVSAQVSEAFTMLSLSQVDERSTQALLAKSSWATFVNLSQISSVVLHSERPLRREAKQGEVLHPGLCKGVWFTIHGPRVCWGRRLQPVGGGGQAVDGAAPANARHEVVGATDGFRLGRDLALGLRMRWLRISMSIVSTSLPEPQMAPARPCSGDRRSEEDSIGPHGELTGPPGRLSTAGEARQTYLVVHFFGRRFESQRVQGNAPAYFSDCHGPLRLNASVPVSEDLASVAALDHHPVNIDVVEWEEDRNAPEGTRQRDRGLSRTIWAGAVPLWQLFTPQDSDVAAENDPVRRRPDARGTLDSAMHRMMGGRFSSLRDALSDSSRIRNTGVRTVPLTQPFTDGREQYSAATIQLEALASFEQTGSDPTERAARAAEQHPMQRNACGHAVVVSPELQGCGNVASLYTSHRAAWYDLKAGDHKGFASQVPSFLELSIGELKFPDTDRPDVASICKYHVEAVISGVSVPTKGLVRPKAAWNRVVISDTGLLDFDGQKLYVPLPPGSWCSPDARPQLELYVVRSTELELQPTTFSGLLASMRQGGSATNRTGATYRRDMVYRSIVMMDGFGLDETRSNLQVPLTDSGLTPLEVNPRNPPNAPRGAAVLTLTATLRDRDFVRLQSPKEFGQGSVVYVGDKATLEVEEPIEMPHEEQEHRQRCFPGAFDPDNGGMSGAHGHFVTLRDPLLPHERANSGLDTLENPPPFRPKAVPPNVEDILPHKYVLPKTQMAFIREGRAGVFRRVIDRLVGKAIQNREAAKATSAPVVVEELSHVRKHIPVTVLAVYANHMCDVELDANFMEAWSRRPERSYILPGSPSMQTFQDRSDYTIWRTETGAGDCTTVERKRYILARVPLTCVNAVQAAGFNIYDASYASVEDAIKDPPCDSSDPFNPRVAIAADQALVRSHRLGGYKVSAGPLPADAGPACQYEWSLHMFAQSEDEMYRFVNNLRACVRLDLHEQMRKLEQFWSKERNAALAPPTIPRSLTASTSTSGHLEVVLVEARHLVPQRFLHDRDFRDTVARLTTADPNANCSFKVVNAINGDELQYRGTKVQFAPVVSGSSPKWYSVPELANSGGWVFKTPEFDPGRMPCLGFEIQFLFGGKPNKPMATARVPMTGGQTGIRYQLDGDWQFAVVEEIRPSYEDRAHTTHKIRVWGNDGAFDKTEWVILDNFRQRLYYSEEDQDHDEGVDFTPCAFTSSRGVDPSLNLCGGTYEDRFHNLWVPLCRSGQEELGNNSDVVPEPAGEVHIYCLWVPSLQQNQGRHWEPTTARAWRAHLVRPKLHLPEHMLREPSYSMQVRMEGYNPNVSQISGWPKTRAEELAERAEAMMDTRPYLECLDRDSEVMWQAFLRELQENEICFKSLGDLRLESTSLPYQMSYRLTDLIRRGVPPAWRRHVWPELLHGDRLKAQLGGPGLDAFRMLLSLGTPQRTEAMVQLQEDVVGGSSWDSGIGAPLDHHLHLLSRAQNVCIAINAFNQDPGLHRSLHFRAAQWEFGGLRQATYSESLLVLAFFILVAQAAEPIDTGHYSTRGDRIAAPTASMSKDSSWMGMKSSMQAQAAQHDVDEDTAFWMLSALTQSPGFSPYYTAPRPYDTSVIDTAEPMFAFRDETPISDRPAAMEDVYQLNMILLRQEGELWVHLQALGFQLASVFYGAFMRLFAFYLPPASLFRFWDLLFADATAPATTLPAGAPQYSTNPAEDRVLPRRRGLINLAFGTLQSAKGDLLKCQSALEVRACIVGRLEAMQDPSAVIELAADMERLLWQDPLLSRFEVTPPHVLEYEKWYGVWDLDMHQYRLQNLTLRDTVQNLEIDLAEAFGEAVRSNPLVDGRVTTRNVVNVLIPMLQQALMPEGAPASHHHSFAGMFRPTRNKLRSIAPVLDTSISSKVSGLAAWAYESAMRAAKVGNDYQPPPVSMPRPPGAFGEPTFLDEKALQVQMARTLGPNWGSHSPRLYAVFKNSVERRASLNEIFAALLSASRGTVGEKAVALFHLYATHMPAHTVHHITPISHAAQTVIERIDGGAMGEAITLHTGPEESEVKAMALHFRVFTSDRTMGEVLLGEAYVPTLKPFMQAGFGQEYFVTFTIWGPTEEVPPGVAAPRNQARANRGDLITAITWTPTSEDTPEVGQLGITLDSIKFNQFVEEPQLKNPHVTVVTYNEDGYEVPIPRWNPRTTAMLKMKSLPTGMLLGDHYGENITFPQTMWRDRVAGYLHSHLIGVNHGWNEEEKTWSWDRRIGQQYSLEDFGVRPELVSTPEQSKPNVISLKACRLLASGILQRGLYCLTNRQASLMADSIFSRAGAVPAILEAILVQMDWDAGELTQVTNISKFKQDLEKKGTPFVDVRCQMVISHEEFVSKSRGNLNLFTCVPDEAATPMTMMSFNCADPQHLRTNVERAENHSVNLSALRIHDPFPGRRKVLLIRFARGGDGQRYNAQYNVDGLGDLPMHELAMDMAADSQAARIQMSLTKEEFVTCVMTSPILSEALRKMTLFDMPGHREGVHEILMPIKLDVVVGDPMNEDADADFLDAINVRQSVAFEIYDYDRGSFADFLGECFLPPFDKLTSSPQRFVLEVRNATDSSRPDRHKENSAQNTGSLFIEASWIFPVEHVEEEHASKEKLSLEERAQIEEKAHTGKLKLKILKAEGLRAADVTKSKATNDAYVCVYVRNEAFTEMEHYPVGFGPGGWRQTPTGVHKEEFRTKIAKGTSPEWDEEHEMLLMTASFEKRTQQKQRHLDVTRRQAKKHANEMLIAALGNGDSELNFFFTDEPVERRPDPNEESEPGDRHQVKIYLGDTIFQFKIKLQEAARREAAREGNYLRGLRGTGEGSDEVVDSRVRLQQYETLADKMCHDHVVMVFVPSKQLREMYRAKRADTVDYENLYMVEFADPSSWQPLDPIRTFMHYAPIYGFGALGADAQQLRVVQGNEEYKMKNSRYRHFVQDQTKWRSLVTGVNTAKQCFGYAKYLHRGDGDSEEWRPVLAERLNDHGEEESQGTKKFKASYLHVASADVEAGAMAGESADASKVLVDETRVLLAPVQPKILGTGNFEQAKLLKQATQLEGQGMTEAEIVRHLNQQQEDMAKKRAELQESAGLPVTRTHAPPITQAMVRAALRGAL